LRSQKETKATNTKKTTLSFFGFSHFFNHHFIQKNKIALSFLVFSRSRPKKQKRLGKTKKNKHEPQTKHSLKVLVFWFFGFLDFFFDFVNGAFAKSLQILFFVGFLEVFCFWVFPMDSLPKSRQILFFCFQLVLIVCTATTHKTSLKNN